VTRISHLFSNTGQILVVVCDKGEYSYFHNVRPIFSSLIARHGLCILTDSFLTQLPVLHLGCNFGG
jgi:hypothetical protein